MKKLICTTLVILLLVGCSSGATPPASTSQPDLSDSSQGDNLIPSFLDSVYATEALNIEAIENATVMNVAWNDYESIYFITQTFPDRHSDTTDWEEHPVAVHHYNTASKQLEQVFQYIPDDYYYYLYIQVQEDGNLALKHNKGFTIVSAKDYTVLREITMPQDISHINYNITYDGSKIAVAYAKEKRLEIWNAKTLTPLRTAEIPKANYIQAPSWGRDNQSLIIFTPKFEFVDMVCVYNYTQDKLTEFDFSTYLNSYDNEAFLAENGQAVFRMDTVGEVDGQAICQFESFDVSTTSSSFWWPENVLPRSGKTVGEKGYVVGSALTEEHSMYIANLNTEQLIQTEEATEGGSKYPPVFAKDQEKAIVMLTMEDSTHRDWTAAIIDCKQVLETVNP